MNDGGQRNGGGWTGRQGLDRKVFIKYVEEKNREFNTRQSRCQIWISKDERPDVRVRELTVAALKRRG